MINKIKTLYNQVLKKNRMAIKSFSQDGEDLILWSFLKYKKNGFYIDIGAHHPLRFSNTHLFYKNGWRGINVDPTPGSMKMFDKLRPLDINLEVGVSDKSEDQIFYMFDEPALNSFDKEISLSRHNSSEYSIIDTKTIEIYTLDDIIEEYFPKSISQIDFLTIDAEGHDFNVIRSINLNKYKPRIIAIEIIELTINDILNDRIANYLSKYGYSMIAKCKRTAFFSYDE